VVLGIHERQEEEDYQGKILGDRFVGCLRRRITKVRYWEIGLWGV
jgi:hypothetical protein